MRIVIVEDRAELSEIRELVGDGIIVVITGMLGGNSEQRVRKAGADGFLTRLESAATHDLFFTNLRNVLQSLFRQPSAYTRNLELAEKLTGKLAAHLPPLREEAKAEPAES